MRTASLIFTFLFAFALSSCDRCKEVTCLNDGLCDGGECMCLPYYEGDQCQLINFDDYLGNYEGTVRVEGINSGPLTYIVSAGNDERLLVAEEQFFDGVIYLELSGDSTHTFIVSGGREHDIAGFGRFTPDRRMLVSYTETKDNGTIYYYSFDGKLQ